MTYADGYYLSDDEEQAKRDAEWAYQVESEMIWEEQSVIRWQLVADLTGSVCIHCGKPCVYRDSRVTTDQTRKLGDVLVHRACADDYVFTTVARIHREAQAERGRRALGVAA